MIYFRAVGHIETLPLLVRLQKNLTHFDEHGILRLIDPGYESPLYKEWGSLRNAVRKARPPDLDVRAIWLERLDPGVATEWQAGLADAPVWCNVPLVVNPACREYCNCEVVQMQVGAIWFRDSRTLNSSANFGTDPRIMLHVELTKTAD